MSTTMDSHVKVVERFFECLAARDLEGAIGSFHESIVIHEPAGLPYGGDYEGHAGVQQLIGNMMGVYDFRIDTWDVRVTGEDGCVGLLEAVFTARETQKSAHVKVAEVYRFTDGLISDAVIYPQDTRAIYELTLPSSGEPVG